MHGGDLVAATLAAHSVPALYTLCGGHISPILIGCAGHGIRVVDTRHEATAVFAADATARLTGRPGVAAVTAGPGLTNTITAVKNAQMAQSPLVLLGGATATILKGRGALQDIDQMALLRPHVKWAAAARTVAEIPRLLQRAFAIAQSAVPGPVFLELPVDLLYPEATVREWYLASLRGKSATARALRTYAGFHLNRIFNAAQDSGAASPLAVPAMNPDQAAVGRAALLLAEARRPLLLVGAQALLDAPG
ncbi:MAG: thiamine pyrophosphate-binding protein, partial [Oscillochloris sp.]|nr:thiamine pyrophosphate-binding protein [Oscillochloris sp.]